MGNATSAGLGSEAPHDERDIRHGGQSSDNRPIYTELAEEAKESEVPRPPASYRITHLAMQLQDRCRKLSLCQSPFGVSSGRCGRYGHMVVVFEQN